MLTVGTGELGMCRVYLSFGEEVSRSRLDVRLRLFNTKAKSLSFRWLQADRSLVQAKKRGGFDGIDAISMKLDGRIDEVVQGQGNK